MGKSRIQKLGKSMLNGTCCKFLDQADMTCTVYPDRFKKAPWCMTVAKAIEANILPNDCPYVVDDPDYECQVMGDEYNNSQRDV